MPLWKMSAETLPLAPYGFILMSAILQIYTCSGIFKVDLADLNYRGLLEKRNMRSCIFVCLSSESSSFTADIDRGRRPAVDPLTEEE